MSRLLPPRVRLHRLRQNQSRVDWSRVASGHHARPQSRVDLRRHRTTTWVLDVIRPRMPLWTWRSQLMVRTPELLANHVLGMGEIRMAGTMPSGHTGILMPQRMYFIDDGSALLAGRTLDIRQRSVPIPESATFSYRPAASRDRPSRLGHPRLRRVHASTRRNRKRSLTSAESFRGERQSAGGRWPHA